MIPLIIDATRVPLMIAGNGAQALRRLENLRGGGAGRVAVFAAAPSDGLKAAAGDDLHNRWPTAEDIKAVQILFIAGVAPDKAGEIAARARDAGVIVNIEDRAADCDFHMPAIMRRGDLLISVSTGGRSPALARRLRRHLEGLIGPEWGQRLDDAATMRADWRAHGDSQALVARKTEAYIDGKGWFE